MEEDLVQESRQALKLYIVLTRTYKTIMEIDQRNIRSYGLNTTEFGVLELLYNKGPHPLQQIGEKILITSGTITYVIDKLVKKGMIVRSPSPEDRRVVYAEITPAGKAKMAEILPNHYRNLAKALDGLNDQEKDQVMVLLKKLSFYAQE